MKNLILTLTLALGLVACGGGGGGGGNTNSAPAVAQNRTPVANFTVACTDLACNFNDSSTDSDGTISGWSWDFGDGNTSTTTSPSHTYSDYGEYTVTLTVTDNDGATSPARTVTTTIAIDVHAQQVTINMDDASVIFKQDFNHRVDGVYTQAQLGEDFECPEVFNTVTGCGGIDNPDAFDVDEAAIQNGEMKVTLSEGRIGTNIGFYKNLGADYNELYLTFTVRFDQNYDQTASGGKLMGLAGDENNAWPPVGCVTVAPDEGFSSRFQYRSSGALSNYVYHQDKTHTCGDSYFVEDGSSDNNGAFGFQKEVMYTLEMHVVMNTVGQANGFIETYINGVLLKTQEGFTFSESGSYGINQFLFQTYIGGATADWELANPSTLYLDNFVLSTERVVQ